MKDEIRRKIEEIDLEIDKLELRRKKLLSELGEGSLSWGMVIAGTFGALLTGLGVIALFAANWDAFGRGARAVIALLPVVVCGVAAVWAYAKGVAARVLWEPLGVLWCISVAAAVCLVAQTYHVGGAVPGLLLLVALLMLPVIWVTRSAVATALWPIMAVAWTISCRVAGVEASFGLAGKSLALMALSLPAYVVFLRSRPQMAALAPVQIAMGLAYSLGLGILLLSSLPGLVGSGTAVIYIFWLCAALVAGAGYAFSLPFWGGVGAIVAVGTIFPVPFMQSGITYVVALVVAVGIVKHGVSALRLGFANLGAAALLWLVLLKFFTCSVPFVFKGMTLVMAGGLLTAFNIAFLRRRGERRALR